MALEDLEELPGAKGEAVKLLQQQEPQAEKQPPQEQKKPAGIELERSAFIIQEGTRKEERRVRFGEDLKDQYKTFLENHLDNVLRIPPTERERILYDHDREIIGLLTTNGKVDEGKIENFLRTERGWIIANHLLEYQTALKLHALALYAAVTPPGQRVNTIAEIRGIPLRGQGLVVSLMHRLLDGGNWEAVMRVVERGFGRGTRLNIRNSAATLQAVANDPVEAEYARRILGVNVQDFRVVVDPATGEQRVELNPGRTWESLDVEGTLKDAREGLAARELFYRSLGVSVEKLDALPEQFLDTYDEIRRSRLLRWRWRRVPAGDLRPQEQTRTTMQQMLQDFFAADRDGIRDTAGRPRSDPNFRQGGAGFDVGGNKLRFMVARRRAIGEVLDNHLRQAPKEPNVEEDRRYLDERINVRKQGGAELERRTGPHKERLALFEQDRNNLQTEQKDFSEYQRKISELQTARRDLQSELTNTLRGVFPTVEEALIGLNDVLNIAGADITINRRAITSVPERRAPLDQQQIDEINNAARTFPSVRNEKPEQTQERWERTYQVIEGRYKLLLAPIEADQTIVENTITRLRGLADSIQEKEQELLSPEGEVNNSLNYLRSFSSERDRLISWGVDRNQLGTLSVNQILSEINRINSANPVNGWHERENGRPDRRMQVLDAIIEERTVADEEEQRRTNPDLQTRFDNFRVITERWGISGHELRFMTTDQIDRRIQERIATNPSLGQPIRPDEVRRRIIENAREEARSRFQIRNHYLTEVLNQTNNNIAIENFEIQRVNLTQEMQTLEVIKDSILSRQDKIFERAFTEVFEERERYMNSAQIDPRDETFTQSERAIYNGSHLRRGYLEIMELLFKYRERADRNEYFQRILRILPPEKLTGIFNRSLHLQSPNMAHILTELDLRIQNNVVSRHDLRAAFRSVVQRLRDEALAL